MFSPRQLWVYKKKSFDGGGWVELYPICFDFWNFFNFAKPLSHLLNLRQTTSLGLLRLLSPSTESDVLDVRHFLPVHHLVPIVIISVPVPHHLLLLVFNTIIGSVGPARLVRLLVLLTDVVFVERFERLEEADVFRQVRQQPEVVSAERREPDESEQHSLNCNTQSKGWRDS